MEFLWCDCVICIFVAIYIFVSSPYLLMFGDDRTWYTGADDVVGGSGEA